MLILQFFAVPKLILDSDIEINLYPGNNEEPLFKLLLMVTPCLIIQQVFIVPVTHCMRFLDPNSKRFVQTIKL